MSNWADWAKRTDDAVDEYFGQLILLQPWLVQSDYLQGGGPDTTRKAVECVGTLEMGMASDPPVGQAGFITRGAQGTITVSLQQAYVDEAKLKEGDVVFLHDDPNAVVKNLVCEISYIEPDATGRPKLMLLRSNVSKDAVLTRKPDIVHAKPTGTIFKKTPRIKRPQQARTRRRGR